MEKKLELCGLWGDQILTQLLPSSFLILFLLICLHHPTSKF